MRKFVYTCITVIVVVIIIGVGICYKTYATNTIVVAPNDMINYYGYSAAKGKYIVLKKDISFEKQVKGRDNTVFEVQDVFDLQNTTVALPEGCVLLFKGGALANGGIIGKGTLIEAPNYQIFIDSFKVAGTFNNTFFYADWFGDIQKAVDIASQNSGIVQLSAKVYDLKESLELKRGVTLLGCGNEAAFLENKGTIIIYRGKTPVIKLAGTTSTVVKNVTIRNLKIRGNGNNNMPGTNVGLYIGPKAYYCKFENISLYACSNGVEIDNGWNLNFESVNPYFCQNGYYLNGKSGAPLTTTVFSSCVAYNSTVGFNFSADMNATTIMSCGTDGCETSMELSGCFGVSIVSYAFERHAKCGIHIDNPNCYVTFVGLSPRALGSTRASHIVIERIGRATFTDMYISNAVVPKDGYTIDVSRKSTSKVVFNNCVLKGNGRNLKDCVFTNDVAY